ncbi:MULTISPECIES: hypothetical protein [unclassified Candidatus Paralachnospira]|uniref:hypothetical protein n=1 Tax=unclassified Candidatus Paralachnospira TaxID=3099471 RepID=UPI003F8DFF9C
MDQDQKNQNRYEYPGTVVGPFQAGKIEYRNPDPVADLAAEIRGNYREAGKRQTVMIKKSKKKYQRKMNDQRIYFFVPDVPRK